MIDPNSHIVGDRVRQFSAFPTIVCGFSQFRISTPNGILIKHEYRWNRIKTQKLFIGLIEIL